MPKPPALLSSLKMLDDSTAELQIMDEIVRDSGWLGGVSDRDVRGWLAEAGGRDLTVRINSPGGDAFEVAGRGELQMGAIIPAPSRSSCLAWPRPPRR